MIVLTTIFEGMASRRDGTFKLVFGTNELTPNQVSELSKALNKVIYMAMKIDQFKTEEVEILDGLESGYEDTGKSQAQRIRSVLFVNWKQNNRGFTDFEAYYRHQTEAFINHMKGKLEQ